MNPTANNPQYKLFPEFISQVDRMILRNGIKFYLNNTFNIPQPVIYQYFDYYKLLYWSGHHILESIEAGLIVRDNIAFIVRFHPAKEFNRGVIHRNKDAQYKLSFRRTNKIYEFDPVVLISTCED